MVFLEKIYERSMLIELEQQGLPAVTQVPIGVYYRGKRAGYYYADIGVADCIILEIKAAEALAGQLK